MTFASPLLLCRDRVLDALRKAARDRTDDGWIECEREAMAKAANDWAGVRGYDRRVTIEDVERLEVLALGHVDYAEKIALYIAELVTGWR